MLTANPMSRELNKVQEIFCSFRAEADRPLAANSRPHFPSAFALEDLAVFHHELHIFQGFDVLQRIATYRDDVGKGSRRNNAESPVHFEHCGGRGGCALN